MLRISRYQFLLDSIASDDGSDTCLEWPYARRNGYGAVYPGGGEGAPVFGVHVVSFAVHNGLALPLDCVVRHACDNPPCYRGKHLLSGTQKDNIHDAIERGRIKFKGEDHNCAKLTEKDVLGIREAYAHRTTRHGLACAEIAEQYGVLQNAIEDIVRGRMWRHVGGPIELAGTKTKYDTTAKTHCKRGHPYAGENIYYSPTGLRNCWQCIRLRRAGLI